MHAALASITNALMALHGEDGAQAAAAKEAATAQLKDAAHGGDEEKAREALAAGANVEAEGEVGWGESFGGLGF